MQPLYMIRGGTGFVRQGLPVVYRPHLFEEWPRIMPRTDHTTHSLWNSRHCRHSLLTLFSFDH